MSYKFKFSVIMPIYNVEKYIEDAIKSVIYQTIGFEENIQIILVNDGSTDNSEKICLKYRKKYPDNIIYIKQTNKGVSFARNRGLEMAEGEYINFLDPDDKWSPDVFSIVYDFFKKHNDEIDVVACRMKYFEGKNGYHQLDYKFKFNNIIDIFKDYNYIQLSSASTFIKRQVFDTYKYDTRLKYSEDCLLIGQIILDKAKYGVLVDAVYNYRKRKANTSALQIRDNEKWRFFDIKEIEYVYKPLMEKSIDKYGLVLDYIQYQIMYDIRIKLKKDISAYLNETEEKEYIKKLKEVLQYIDDKIIIEQKNMSKEDKQKALSLKRM